jgi:hypothetical protein
MTFKSCGDVSYSLLFIFRIYTKIFVDSVLDDLVKQMIAASEKFHFIFSHELEDRIQIKM